MISKWTIAAGVAAVATIGGLTVAGDAPAALTVGAKLPSVELKMKSVDGKEVALGDVKGAKGTLVIFTCNACPYAKGWESRIVDLGNAYAAKGIGVVAVNSNDPKVVPDDGYDQMVTRAKEKGMTFPYVVDPTSGVARAFGATRTPEVFLFDASGALVYHGAVDDNVKSANEVKEKYLQNALDAVVAGKEVTVKETKAVGCGIKFRS